MGAGPFGLIRFLEEDPLVLLFAVVAIVHQLGLVVFVYALGLASGRTALSSLRRRPGALLLTLAATVAVGIAA